MLPLRLFQRARQNRVVLLRIAEPRLPWVAFAVVAVIFLTSTFLLLGTNDDRVRYSGLALELFGISTVAFGLRDKWHLFKRPSILDHLRGWWERRPHWGGKDITVALSGAELITMGTSAKLSLWRGVPAGASIEDRVAALEANVNTVRAEHGETAKHVEEEARKQAEALASERRARELATDEIKNQIETLGAGGLHLEAIGLFWLILGVILTTVSTEIAHMLTWIQRR